MKIVKYPVKIKGENYTAEVKFSPCEHDMLMIQTDLYRGMRKIYQKPEFTFRKRVSIEAYIREAEGEIRSMEEIHEK